MLIKLALILLTSAVLTALITPFFRKIAIKNGLVNLVLGRNIPFAGGGYLRLYPYFFIKSAIRKTNKSQKQPILIYLHPREIDVNQPRLNMPLNRRFKSYVNLHTTEKKLNALLRDFSFDSISEVLRLR